ncbi:MAG TPA: EthD family reductase [Candidatus Methylomirabilis sp.]|nr:EthD family reductase [Candidatus Methylomirabilis sp.]
MAKLLVMYHTPADPAAFDTYYNRTHVVVAKKLPGVRSYTISKGPIASPGGTSPYHLIAELTFDSMGAIQAALGSPEGQAAVADLSNFASAGVTISMYDMRDA